MDVSTFRERLAGRPDVEWHHPLPGQALTAALAQLPLELPAAHRELLESCDGVAVFGGHYRLLGLGDAGGPAMLAWNQPATWKHAWDGRADAFLCFGMSSLGDQWAYREGDQQVWTLDAFEMQPLAVADDFEGFLGGLAELATDGADELVVGARERVGDLSGAELLGVMPPVQFGVEDVLSRLRPLPPASALTFNGDAWRQASHHADEAIRGLEVRTDEQGRFRLHFMTDANTPPP